VLVECVTLWLSNLFEHESSTPVRAVRELADACRLREVIAVINEVGGWIVPTTRVGRRFRDLQGWANQILAAEAESVVLIVPGLPLALKLANRWPTRATGNLVAGLRAGTRESVVWRYREISPVRGWR
jgi:adenosylcobinamide kinase/adenosylcobinamide-phosphate guanylyltransferase